MDFDSFYRDTFRRLLRYAALDGTASARSSAARSSAPEGAGRAR